MSCFVDADHAGCHATRRSHTGILIYVQNTPIIWYSKRQNTVESSTFGSEFIAMKTAVEQVEALQYKLRMMGIAIDGPTNMYVTTKHYSRILNFQNQPSRRSIIRLHTIKHVEHKLLVLLGSPRNQDRQTDLIYSPSYYPATVCRS
jgi:hypothetical protein